MKTLLISSLWFYANLTDKDLREISPQTWAEFGCVQNNQALYCDGIVAQTFGQLTLCVDGYGCKPAIPMPTPQALNRRPANPAKDAEKE